MQNSLASVPWFSTLVCVVGCTSDFLVVDYVHTSTLTKKKKNRVCGAEEMGEWRVIRMSTSDERRGYGWSVPCSHQKTEK